MPDLKVSGDNYDPDTYWIEREKRHGPRYVGNVDNTLEEVEAKGLRIVEQLRSLGVMEGRQYALDYGCGIGRLIPLFLSSPELLTYTGVDIVPAAIEEARSRLVEAIATGKAEGKTLHLDCVQPGQEIARALYPPDCFDLIVTVTVIQHMPDEHARKLLREFADLARPGCRFVFMEHEPEDPQDYNHYPQAPHMFPRSPDWFADLLPGFRTTFIDRKPGKQSHWLLIGEVE